MPGFADFVPAWARDPEKEALARHILDGAKAAFDEATLPPVAQAMRSVVERVAREQFERETAPSILETAGSAARGMFDQMTKPLVDAVSTAGTAVGTVATDLRKGFDASVQAQRSFDQTAALTSGPAPTAGQEIGPAGFTLPETGTPEGSRITSALAETATRNTPGAGAIQGLAQAMGPGAPMTADTPGTNALGLGALATTPITAAGNAAQAATQGVVDRLPGGETSVLSGLGVREDTPFLGGLTTPDTAIPAAVGLLTPGVNDLGRAAQDAGTFVVGRADDLAAATREAGGIRGLLADETGTMRLPGSAPVEPPARPPAAPGSAAEALDRTLDMFAKGHTPPAPSTEIEKALGDVRSRAMSAWADRLYPLERAQKLVYDRLGRAPTPEEDVYLQARLYAGRGEAAAVQVRENLLPALRRVDEADRDLLNGWLAVADNADKARATGNAGRTFSGDVKAVDLDAARQEIVNRVGPQRAQAIFDAADGVWNFTSQLRTRMRDAGLISDDVYQDWERNFSHYTRSDILKYLSEDGGASLGGSQSFGTLANNGIRALTEAGTASARDLPVNSVIRQAFAVEGQVRRNETAQALLNMAKQDAELGALFKPARSGKGPVAGETTFNVFVNGQKQSYIVPETVENLFRLDPPQIKPTLQAALDIAFLAPVLRAGATGKNLLFIPYNAIRDAKNFLVRTGGASDSAQLFRSLGALGEGYKASMRESIPEWAPLIHRLRQADVEWQQALKIGAGQTSEFSGFSPDQIMQRLTSEHKLLGGAIRPVRDLKSFLGAVQDTVLGVPQAIGNVVETAPRRAEYRLARERGEFPERAALAARDITQDFSRGGTWAKAINHIIPFFNVAVQSPERFLRQDFAPGRRLQSAIGITTGVLLPALAAEAWNRTQYPEDYANVPQYQKDTGLVVMLPGEVRDNPDGSPGQRPYVYVPTPQQFNFLRMAQQAVVEQGFVSMTPEDPANPNSREARAGGTRSGWWDVLKAVVMANSPIGSEGGVPLPPTLRTAGELLANRDEFRNRQIVPDALNQPTLPAPERYTPSTSSAGRALSLAASKLGVEISPMQVDYTVKSLTGGVGAQALEASNMIARSRGLPAAEAAYPAASDIPFVGGLVNTLIRNRGGELDERARKLVQGDMREYGAKAIAALQADPAYQKLPLVAQRDEMRRVANSLGREIKDAQDLGVFSRPGQPGGIRKYIGAKTPYDDARIERAEKLVEQWFDDPTRYKRPDDATFRLGMTAVLNPRWEMAEEEAKERQEAIKGKLPVPENRRALPNAPRR